MRQLLHFYKNRPEWMNEFYNQLRIMLAGRKLLLLLGISYLAFFIFLAFTGDKNSKMTDWVALQNKRSVAILHELDDIHSVLHEVESNPLTSQQQQMALQVLEKNIVSAQKSMVDVAKTSDIQKISGQITLVKDDIDTQVSDIKKMMAQNGGGKEWLEASALPFRVISVDVMGGQPYVTVNYAEHIAPLAIGDLLSGWRVVSADYEAGVAEFVNEKSQYVKVSLQGG